jgi:iron complex transport system ATP-binding protein
MIAVEAFDLCCAYQQVPVLDHVSLTMKKGECFIVIGPNGSGKTTLMQVLSGIRKPQAGKVTILGQPLEGYRRKALARRIALVPQNIPAEFPFTVFETVLQGRSPHTGPFGIEGPKDIEQARQAMAFTHVEHLGRRRMDQLSGGERQRVFIARAICQEPEILFLDEPTAALDLAYQIQVMDLLETLKEQKGTTIAMISHDINLAAMYGDRLLLLCQGKVMCQGRPDEVLTFPMLETAYGCVVLVDKNPLGGVPRVTPVPKKQMIER